MGEHNTNLGRLWHDEFEGQSELGCALAMGVLFAAVQDPVWAEHYATGLAADLALTHGAEETEAKLLRFGETIRGNLPIIEPQEGRHWHCSWVIPGEDVGASCLVAHPPGDELCQHAFGSYACSGGASCPRCRRGSSPGLR